MTEQRCETCKHWVVGGRQWIELHDGKLIDGTCLLLAAFIDGMGIEPTLSAVEMRPIKADHKCSKWEPGIRKGKKRK